MNRQIIEEAQKKTDKFLAEHPEVPVISVPIPEKLRTPEQPHDPPVLHKQILGDQGAEQSDADREVFPVEKAQAERGPAQSEAKRKAMTPEREATIQRYLKQMCCTWPAEILAEWDRLKEPGRRF